MLDKMKLRKNLKKLIIIIICIIIIISIYKTFSKYQSNSTGEGDIDVAFYIVKEGFQNMSLSLNAIEPRQEPYVYTFTIANTDGTNRTETDLEYDLEIKTTTNLPLTYELYMNENYNSSGATNIIRRNTVITDEYGTYFRTITTDTENFGYQIDQINTYNLVVYFPEIYKSINYQNIIEGITINVNSKQILSD